MRTAVAWLILALTFVGCAPAWKLPYRMKHLDRTKPAAAPASTDAFTAYDVAGRTARRFAPLVVGPYQMRDLRIDEPDRAALPRRQADLGRFGVPLSPNSDWSERELSFELAQETQVISAACKHIVDRGVRTETNYLDCSFEGADVDWRLFAAMGETAIESRLFADEDVIPVRPRMGKSDLALQPQEYRFGSDEDLLAAVDAAGAGRVWIRNDLPPDRQRLLAASAAALLLYTDLPGAAPPRFVRPSAIGTGG